MAVENNAVKSIAVPKTWSAEIQWAMSLVDRQEFDFENSYTYTNPTKRIQIGDAAAAIHKAKGVIVTAAKLIRRPRGQLHDLILKDPDLRDFYDQYREAQLDLVEKTVFDKAIEGDVGAAKFLLDRLGKQRGYSTKTEVEHDVTGSLQEMIQAAQTGNRLPSDIESDIQGKVVEYENGGDTDECT